MGIFQSTDKLDELRKRFLEPDKQLYEILIYEVVENFSNLISPRYKDKQKTTSLMTWGSTKLPEEGGLVEDGFNTRKCPARYK